MTVCFTGHGRELLDRIEHLRALGEGGKGIGAGGAYFDMQDTFYRFTFDSIGEIAFGVNVGCLTRVCAPVLCATA